MPRYLSAVAVVALAPALAAAQFAAGDLVIYRVGTGTGSLTNTGNPIFLDEYTPTGTLVQSVPLPADFIASGTATSEGLPTVSPNGQFLAVTGYKATTGGATSLPTTTSATVPRSVAVFDASATIQSRTDLTDFASGSNPRGAVTTNGTDVWVAGGAGGVRYATAGSTASTQLSTTVTNLRQVNVFGGQLYVSDSSGTAVRIGAVGTGTPTTSGQTITNLPGTPASTGSPYGFVLADLDPGVAGVDTLYFADDSVGLKKYSLVGGTWTDNGTVGAAADAYRGLAAAVAGSAVTLYATRRGGSGAAGGGELVSLVDVGGYNGAFAGAPTLLATAAPNTAFRGVALTPFTPVPEPAGVSAAAILGLAGFAAARRAGIRLRPAADPVT